MSGRPDPPSRVTVRPIQPSDVASLERFYADLSVDSRTARFLGSGPSLGHAGASSFCTTDHAHREGFVAVTAVSGERRIVGHVCIEPDGGGSAEVAIAVADAYQGQGIGRRLLSAAVAWAQAAGLRRLDATAFVTNARIARLFQHAGPPVHIDHGGGPVCALSLDLAAGRLAA